MPQRSFQVNPADYPFVSRWFVRDGTAMHYVDDGPPDAAIAVVFCHGNPTWSFLYRDIIKALAPAFRCIAYDLPGFGFSEHPPGYSYTPQAHAAWVEALLFEHLKLTRFVIVVQDWGGPIGLDIATRHPDRICGVVISSTWAWRARWIGQVFSALMGSRLGQYLILQRNLFAATLLPLLLGKPAPPWLRKAYTDPFPTPASRIGTAVFPVQIVAATPWLEEIERRLPSLADKPVEFIFGLKDLGTRPADIAAWRAVYPHAQVQTLPDASHFTQEDSPGSYVIAVRRILAGLGE